MNVLDLFSGIGGFSLGLHRAGMTTVAFCEIEPYPQAVLRKNFPGVPIYEDVRTLTAERLRTDGIDRIDVICGGFPCQPFSNAGKQRGTEDHRHLWPEMLRLVQECKPTWVIGENVAGFVNMALDDVSADLENAGYEVQPFVIPACAVGAPHRRDRVWILAYASGRRCGKQNEGEVELKGRTESVSTSQTVADSDALRKLQPQGCQQEQRDRISNGCQDVADATSKRLPNRAGGGKANELPRDRAVDNGSSEGGRSDQWSVEPRVGRVANGVSHRVDRIKGLGNAVVPEIPEIIGRAIMEIEGGKP